MKTFTLIKKNRVYFAAKINGYSAKLVIDDNSKELELGEHSLELEDISVRTKYGTDLIFKLSAPVEAQKEAGICTLKPAQFNHLMLSECRKLGGVWESDLGVWVFSGIIADEVEDLEERFNDLATYKVKFLKGWSIGQKPFSILGVDLACATGRDSGASNARGLIVLNGGFSSGGSMKNWTTRVSEKTVIIFQFPRALVKDLEKYEQNHFNDVVFEEVTQ